MRELWKDECISKILRFLAASAVVYLAFRFILPLVLPFVFAGLLAALLYPAVRFLHQKLHLSTFLGGGILLLIFIVSVGAGIFFLGRILVMQLIGFFRNFEVYEQYISQSVGGLCSGCDRIFRLERGKAMEILSTAMTGLLEKVQSHVLPALTEKTLRAAAGTAVIVGSVLITLVSALMIIKDMEEYKKSYRHLEETPVIGGMLQCLRGGCAVYLRTQLRLLLVIAAILSVGLFLLGNPYALLLGIAIAIFDAFPVLGSGLILVPWAVTRLFAGDYYRMVVLLILFMLCQVIRELVEPKLLGGSLGIRPIAAMMAIYIGVKLFGVSGVILGPLGMIFLLGLMAAPEAEHKE